MSTMDSTPPRNPGDRKHTPSPESHPFTGRNGQKQQNHESSSIDNVGPDHSGHSPKQITDVQRNA